MTTRPWLMLAVLSLAACIALHASEAGAVDPAQSITQYSHRAWTVRDGFIKGAVTSIAQTEGGYLWLGTHFGLVRFDGARAVPWVPPQGSRLPSPEIVSLLSGRDGTLWIGTLRGLISWKPGREAEYKQLADFSISALTESADGTVWVAGYSFSSKGKLCAIRMMQVSCELNDRLGNGALGLRVDTAGTLWVAVVGGFWRWAPGLPQFYPMGARRSIYLDFGEDGTGGLLIPSVGRMERLNAGVLETAYSYPASLRSAHGSRILRDHDGADWIATLGDGLIRERGGVSEAFASADGLTGNNVGAILEDHEGNIWVATDKGLDRFSRSSVATFSERQGLVVAVWVTAARDGSIWASAPGRIYRVQEGRVTQYGHQNAKSSSTILPSTEVAVRDLPPFEFVSLFADARGRTWVVGTEISGYLQASRFVALRDIPTGIVYAMTGDSAGNIWMSNSEHGLVHVVGDHLLKVFSWSEIGDKGLATALATDGKDERVWIGFAKGGISTLTRGIVERSFTPSDGLGSGRVSDLRFDSDGTLWAATDGGMSRLKDGHFDTLDASHGLACNRLYWSVRADDRSLWMYGDCGLIRVAGAEIDAWSANKTSTVRSTLLDASDGVSLFSGDLSGVISPQAAIASDGNIWFRTPEGLSKVRPHELVVNSVAPAVQIERLVANGLNYDPSQSVHLPSHIRDLALEYTALSFVAPEKIHFRYRLEGQDSNWREVVNDRRVQYSNLGPGTYRFRVIADNNSGVWNERGATLEISVAPAYWQTLWFRTASALILVVTLWLLYRARSKQIVHAFERTLDARVAERTRIARDLHDTLLQSFHGLLLQFQAASSLFKQRPAEAKQLLDGAINQAAEAITEGRDAVQGLRSSVEDSNNLAEAIGSLTEELSADQARARPAGGTIGPIDIRLNIDGVAQDLHPIVRDEIYRIAAEALRNAVQHSCGSRIEVHLHFGRWALRLRIHDNGVGIDPKVVGGREGHFGLAGMRERAELAGGQLAIWSAPNVGTEVEFTVPAARVYAPARIP
jgi:signal transduction histidine kinase/ligand-binding sensor domain-containing protein